MNLIRNKIFEYLQTKMHVIDNEFLYEDEYKHHLINPKRKKKTTDFFRNLFLPLSVDRSSSILIIYGLSIRSTGIFCAVSHIDIVVFSSVKISRRYM